MDRGNDTNDAGQAEIERDIEKLESADTGNLEEFIEPDEDEPDEDEPDEDDDDDDE